MARGPQKGETELLLLVATSPSYGWPRLQLLGLSAGSGA